MPLQHESLCYTTYITYTRVAVVAPPDHAEVTARHPDVAFEPENRRRVKLPTTRASTPGITRAPAWLVAM